MMTAIEHVKEVDKKYVIEKYQNKIDYYWSASRSNKNSLTVINGLGQNFHWGSTWRDMVINATRLEKERDRFLATKSEKRDIQKELEILNLIVLEETRSFFQRVLDSEIKPKDQHGSSA